MRVSLRRLGMTWGKIGHQRGKVKSFEQTNKLDSFVFARLNIRFHRTNKIPMLVFSVM